MNFKFSYDTNQVLSVLRTEASKLKHDIFDIIILGHNRQSYNKKIFLNLLNDTLREWESYGKQLRTALGQTKFDNDRKIKTIPYADIKGYVYARYDYPSVLKFIDGTITGISENNIENSGDVSEFFERTLELAFKLNVDTVGGLIEQTFTRIAPANWEVIDTHERTMYENIRSYNELFPAGDRAQVFESVEEAVKALLDIDNTYGGSENIQYNRDILIALINCTMEYVLFTIYAYILRIAAIGIYFQPIWEANQVVPTEYLSSEEGHIHPVGEATETDEKDEKKEDIKDKDDKKDTGEKEESSDKEGAYEPLLTYDHVNIRDVRKLKAFFEVLREFALWAGVSNSDLVETKSTWVDDKKIGSNSLLNLCADNQLHLLIRDHMDGLWNQGQVTNNASLEEFRHNLRCALTPALQALPCSVTAKDMILHIIRGTNVGKSVSEIKKSIGELFNFGFYFCTRLQSRLQQLGGVYSDNFGTMMDQKLLGECHTLLLEFYQDFIFAVYRKSLFLARELGRSKIKEAYDVHKLVSMDNLVSDWMNVAVPDTMRMPIELEDQFTLPVFEYLEMRDEMLRNLPDFRGDIYLTEEAGGNSSLINAMLALLQGIWNSVNAFFRNFAPAAKWVTANETALLNLQFDDTDPNCKMEIFPYDISNIRERLSGLEAVKNINLEDAVKNLDDFTKKLYGTDGTVYDWFDKLGSEKGLARFNNYLLFGRTDDVQVKPIQITGNTISEYLKGKDRKSGWILSVKQSPEIMKQFSEINQSLMQVVNFIKGKAAKPIKESVFTEDATTPGTVQPTAPNQGGTTQQPGTAGTAGTATNTSSTTATAGTTDQQPNQPNAQDQAKQQKEQQQNIFSQVISRVQKAMVNLWAPTSKGVLTALRNEYGYLKTAYGIATAKQAATAQAQPQQQQTQTTGSAVK